jgi:hypothetical protein
VNGELDRKWKEAAVAYFKVLSQHLRGETEEDHDHNLLFAHMVLLG